MTTQEEILHYISETMKLYPTMSFVSIIHALDLPDQLLHKHNSDAFILDRVKVMYNHIKNNQNEQIRKKNITTKSKNSRC
jgi:hypothetical protein